MLYDIYYNIRKVDWLSDSVTLLDIVSGHNLYALIDDILSYKINNKPIIESLSAITKYESVLNKLNNKTILFLNMKDGSHHNL